MRRHIDCARNPEKESVYGEGRFFKPQASETGKRMRTKGHGHSGGDGFKDHFQ